MARIKTGNVPATWRAQAVVYQTKNADPLPYFDFPDIEPPTLDLTGPPTLRSAR